MKTLLRSVCVFCGSNSGTSPDYALEAVALGRELASREIELVYGGGNIGLMGTIADAVLKAGGRVTGVIPQLLADKELAHPGLTELAVVNTMHERKALMAERSDAFIAMPGGIGTYEEFFEMLTWTQLKIHQKPCGLLNVRRYWSPLLAMLDHSVNEGFLKPKHRENVLLAETIPALLSELESFRGSAPG
jgi:uncharacterized protein (TIGR00730 family)